MSAMATANGHDKGVHFDDQVKVTSIERSVWPHHFPQVAD